MTVTSVDGSVAAFTLLRSLSVHISYNQFVAASSKVSCPPRVGGWASALDYVEMRVNYKVEGEEHRQLEAVEAEAGHAAFVAQSAIGGA